MSWSIARAQIAIPTITNTQFVFNGTVHKLEIAENEAYTIWGETEAINAGYYWVDISLKDKNNYEWSDGTTYDVGINWSIAKVQIARPTITNTQFVFNGTDQKPEIAENEAYGIYICGDWWNDWQWNYFCRRWDCWYTAEAIDVGDYRAIISLKDTDNYEWSDETTNNIEIEWSIARKPIVKPTITNTQFVFNGTDQRPEIAENEPYTISHIEYCWSNCRWNDSWNWTDEAIDVGDYRAAISFKSSNYEWSDGTDNEIYLYWSIARKPITKPTITNTQFVFNGTDQKPEIAENEAYTITYRSRCSVNWWWDYIDEAINAGDYEVTISLNYNYEWSDRTTHNITLSWSITRAQITIPTITNNQFVFNGTVQKLEIAENEAYAIFGETEAIDAGDYWVEISLKDKNNYEWSDGTTYDVGINWSIARAQIAKPTITNTQFVFNGTVHKLEIAENEAYTIWGETEAINAGYYWVDISLNDPNYEWTDGTTSISINWSIAKVQVARPTIANTQFVFNGTEQSVEIAENELYIITGDKATNPGNHTATIRLRNPENYEWVDGTTNNITLPWSIAKAAGVWVALSPVTRVFSSGLILANIPLPADYSWVVPTTPLEFVDRRGYAATYIHPSGNYEAVRGNIVVNIVEARTDITNKFTDPVFRAEVYRIINKSAPTAIFDTDVDTIQSLYCEVSWLCKGLIGGEEMLIISTEQSVAPIKSLSGIEYLTGLKHLHISGNELTSIDLSNNTVLKYLNVSNNLFASKGAITGIANERFDEKHFIFGVQNIETSISRAKKSDNRHGIRFAQNIVSDKAEISVVLPSNERVVEAKIAIYDMTGNAVFSTTTRDNVVWDLRNTAGRIVANGTYLVVAEAKDHSGKVYQYSARLGVKR